MTPHTDSRLNAQNEKRPLFAAYAVIRGFFVVSRDLLPYTRFEISIAVLVTVLITALSSG